MLFEAFEYLVSLGADKTEKVKIQNGSELVFRGNSNEPYVAPYFPPPCNYVFYSSESLVLFALNFEHPMVFVGRSAIEMYHDRNDRRDKSVMPLSKSMEAEAVERLMEYCLQSEVVELLRGPLLGCVDESYAKLMQRIDFEVRRKTRASVSAGKESLGREIESQAESANGEIPEHIALTFPWFSDFPHFSVSVKFSLCMDVPAETMKLVPVGSKLEASLNSTIERIASYIAGQFAGFERDDEIVFVGSSQNT